MSHHGSHGDVLLPVEYARDHVRLGYAATEHGTQSDTVTIGINLASPATGRRGLYVGATRGRERNTILVVTDSEDLDEARDTLESILASDRADIPAVAQRQFLAGLGTDRDTPPERANISATARFVVPDSFAAVDIWLREQLAVSRAAIRDRAGRHRQLDALAADLRRASVEFEPYRQPLAAARRRVDHVASTRASIQRRLDNRRGRDRRDARRHLPVAEQAVANATAHLDQLEALAAGPRDRYREVLSRHASLRRDMTGLDILDQWSDHPARAEHLDHLHQALVTWTRWAHGDDIPPDRLAAGASLLDRYDQNITRPDVEDVAATVRAWAHGAGIDLAPPTPALSQPSLDLGLR